MIERISFHKWLLVLLLCALVASLTHNRATWKNVDRTRTAKPNHLSTTAIKHYFHYVPFPYQVSKWSQRGGFWQKKERNFYHTLQCLWTGIEASRLDPVVAARHPEQVVLVADRRTKKSWRRRNHEPGKIVDKIVQGLAWNTSADLTYDELVLHNNRTRNHLNLGFLSRAMDPDQACRYVNMSYMADWFSKYLHTRYPHKISRALFDTCTVESMQAQLQAVLLNRPPGARHLSELSVQEILSQLPSHSPSITWKYKFNLASQDWMTQLLTFASHQIIVLPHGAMEANVVAATRWEYGVNRSMIPTTVVELCPEYAHCICVGNFCPTLFQRDMHMVAYFGIAFERHNQSCEHYCARFRSAGRARHHIKQQPIPHAPNAVAGAIHSILKDQILPRLSAYCRGDSVPVKDSTLTVLKF